MLLMRLGVSGYIETSENLLRFRRFFYYALYASFQKMPI
ncbi:hypothetical protein HMPREF0860_0620 [Treponema socranskii subsp. socranskii VPI DR56BR1116 = ATCC 35536]|uniref:Uncharacterized protein n=1 Tax=Treponema socranskii subsp. socranskii VPI DR56BR1116 = ATCC 35536 TaxID=1125725 RepID=U1FAH5_TRESO|nr:hypothetical protein HMPREF1325_1592 [Treponema socranskii subsp. socranskii VPI DR56BR1116 = ATCC 35536]ERK05033.1 hypothetical protein HMPREF0860_0620 [Treponema socranskii subsp. socranskii VPI DR56BR1116 = ATCC 35536]